jgi:RNA polymerase sigma factor (sigma-70 family)
MKNIKITLAEEKMLYRRMHRGEDAARDELIEHHMPYAYRVAERLCGRSFPIEEVASAIRVALCDACVNFDPSKGRFRHFSAHHVRRAVYALWRDRLPLTASRRLYTQMRDAGVAFQRVSMDELITSSEGELLVDTYDGAQAAEKADLTDWLFKALDTLDPREHRVLFGRYFLGQSFAEIGAGFIPRAVSREWIRRIHDAAIAKLKLKIVK